MVHILKYKIIKIIFITYCRKVFFCSPLPQTLNFDSVGRFLCETEIFWAAHLIANDIVLVVNRVE